MFGNGFARSLTDDVLIDTGMHLVYEKPNIKDITR